MLSIFLIQNANRVLSVRPIIKALTDYKKSFYKWQSVRHALLISLKLLFILNIKFESLKYVSFYIEDLNLYDILISTRYSSR